MSHSSDKTGCCSGDETSAVPLTHLRRGQRARLHRADLHCDDCELLNAMGLTEQCELRVCRRGEPYIVQVNATRLGLAASVAGRIHVHPIASVHR
jgi:Fe2+ transport system protein FeoA